MQGPGSSNTLRAQHETFTRLFIKNKNKSQKVKNSNKRMALKGP